MKINLAPPSSAPIIRDMIDSLPQDQRDLIAQPDLFTTVNGSSMSCGISTLWGLGATPVSIVNKVLHQRAATDRKWMREAFVVFSDLVHGAGARLCKYIRDNNLGNITEIGPRMNPNTGNMIKIWVWEPPHESLDPKDKYLPVFGKEIYKDGYGDVHYRDDPRFSRHTTEDVY